MANGIANNREEEKKSISKSEGKGPAEQGDNSDVCVSSFAKTPTKGIIGFRGISTRDELKEQIRNGEYKAIKLSDRPIQIEQSVEPKKPVKEAEVGD